MTSSNRKPPKGGSKGGTRFPRITLKKSHEYSNKLVSKTHTGSQPESVILPGVFGNSGGEGKVRASALKQYDLLDGSPKAYEASKLAKNINSAPPEDIAAHLKKAFLKPKVFKTLFDTFCNDSVTRARIRQQASNLKVHPDTLDDCVQVFVDSAIYCGLATESGENVEFHATPAISDELSEREDDLDIPEDGVSDAQCEQPNGEEAPSTEKPNEEIDPPSQSSGRQKSNIDIKIDPSMDPEKLDKLLAVLQKYGQL